MTWERNRAERVAGLFLDHAKQRRFALELACGYGYASEFLAEQFDQVVGVDISYERLASGVCRAGESPFAVAARAEQLPLAADAVDLVGSYGALHHFCLPEALGEIARVLRPGGVAVLVDFAPPATTPLSRGLDQVWRALKASPQYAMRHGLRESFAVTRYRLSLGWWRHVIRDKYLTAREIKELMGAFLPGFELAVIKRRGDGRVDQATTRGREPTTISTSTMITPKGRPGILVVGDIMLDVLATPAPPRAVDPTQTNHIDGSVSLKVGGAGLQLASTAAHGAWDPVFLLHASASDGDEIATAVRSRALHILQETGISSIESITRTTAGPSVTVINYLGADRRIMFAAPGANTLPYTDTAIAAAIEALDKVGALFISGYTVFRPGTRSQVLTLADAARVRGVPIALDVVPHAVASRVPREQFMEAVGASDFVVAELNTLLRAAGMDAWPMSGPDVVDAVLEQYLQLSDGLLVMSSYLDYRFVTRDGEQLAGSIEGPRDASMRRGRSEAAQLQILKEHFLPYWRNR